MKASKHTSGGAIPNITSLFDIQPIRENAFKKTQQMFNSSQITLQNQDEQQKQVTNINDLPDKSKFLETQSKKQNLGSKSSMGTFLRKTHETHLIEMRESKQLDQDETTKPQQKSKFQELMTQIKAKIYFRQWRKFMPSRILQVLGNWHYNLLSDKTVVFESNKKECSFQQEDRFNQNVEEGFYLSEMRSIENSYNIPKSFSIIRYLLSNIPLISASGKFRLIWDILQMVVIMIFQFFMPLYITFDVPFYEILHPILAYLIYFILVGDIFVNMNTSYYEKGKQVTDRKIIFLKYISTSFVMDALLILPITIDIFFIKFEIDYLRFIFLIFIIKLKRMYSILSKIQDRFHLISSINSYMQLFNLLIVHLLVSHYFACLWLIVGKSQSGNTWITKRGIDNLDWPVQYINSYYFITLTMITVGYGDITPVTNTEIALCIGTMTFACGVFAYSVSEIGTLIQDLRSSQKEIKINMQTILKYMHNKNISDELKFEIREYLLYYWQEESNKNGEKENIIINQLSDSLKETLIMEANHIVLSDSPVFRDNFSPEILKRTVPLIKEFRCTPEEIIYYEGEMDEGYIYFIEKGSIELYIDISTGQKEEFKALKQLKKGDNFGTIGFFTGLHRTSSVRSLEFTTLLMIKREEFLQLLQEYPQDYERFCYLKDKILIQHDYQKLGLRCYSCKSFYHVLNDCPYLHYVANRFKVIRQATKGQNQRQKDFKRIEVLKYRRTLSCKSEVQQQALIFLEENEELITYLFDYLEEAQNDSSSYHRHESFGPPGVLFRDYSMQPSEIQEEDIKTSSQKPRKRRSNQKISLLASMPQLKTIQSNNEDKIVSSLILLSPSPIDGRRGERKGTIQIQNHRSIIKKLSRLPSQESKIIEKSQEKQGIERYSPCLPLNTQEFVDFMKINLDVLQNFVYYFPHNNISRVLEIKRKNQNKIKNFYNHKKRSKRSTLKSINKVETSSMISLANKYELQKETDDFEKANKYFSKNSGLSRQSLKHHSNFSQKSNHNIFQMNYNISNQMVSDGNLEEENLHSGSNRKLKVNSETNLILTNPYDLDFPKVSDDYEKPQEQQKPAEDYKCGSASFGPELKINYFTLPKSYFDDDDEIKEINNQKV